MGFNGIYDDIASGKHSQFAIEAMAIEIVDFPISMVIFHSFLYVYQRVTPQKYLQFPSRFPQKVSPNDS